MSFSRAGLDATHQKRLQVRSAQGNLKGSSMMVSQEAVTKLDARSKRSNCVDTSADGGATAGGMRNRQDHLGAGANMVPSEGIKHVAAHKTVMSKHADAYKDHIQLSDGGLAPRNSARLKRPAGAYKRKNPNVQSAFEESRPVSDQPKYRKPLTATPWGHDLPSARGYGNYKKVYPKSVDNTMQPRRKCLNTHPAEGTNGAGAAGGGATTHASSADSVGAGNPVPLHQGKKHMGTHANKESTPIEPPAPRPKDKPVAAKFRSTPGLLAFSPRVSSMTPRVMSKVRGQRPALQKRSANNGAILAWPQGAPAGTSSGGEVENKPALPAAGVKRRSTSPVKKLKSRPMTEDPISGLSPTSYKEAGVGATAFQRRHTAIGGDGASAACDEKRVRTKRAAENSQATASHVFSTSGLYGSSPPNAKTEEKRTAKRHIETPANASGASAGYAADTLSHTGKKRATAAPVSGGSVAAGSGGAARYQRAATGYTGPVWAGGYTRSPFDPGSARGMKPHQQLPQRRQHVDPLQ